MKRLTMLIVVAAMGWSGFWLAGYWGISKAFEAWFDARRAEGWVAEYDDLSIRGYPNRLDTTFSNLTLADPSTGVAWDVPFFQLFALSYKPNHVIAVWPHQQTLAAPNQKLTLKTEDMRASLVLRPGTALALERANLSIQALDLSSTADWQLSASTLDLAMHLMPDTSASYRLALRANDLAPPAAFQLPAGSNLPRAFKSFQADLEASFDRPWDRSAIETDRPQPVALDLKTAEIVWGDLQLSAAGAVQIDASGYPTGSLTIRAVNWREMIKIARASGQVSPAMLNTLEQALTFVSRLSGNKKRLEIPLTFGGGATRIGPLRIGPAPRIILR